MRLTSTLWTLPAPTRNPILRTHIGTPSEGVPPQEKGPSNYDTKSITTVLIPLGF